MAHEPILIVSTLTDEDGIFVFRIADGRFAFAADLGTDKVMIYALDAAAGTLTPGEQPFVRVAPGSGPRHFTFAPNNRHAYVINELGNTITAFDYDAERGLLAEQGSAPTLPADFDGVTHTADLCLTPDGRFLYGSNRGHDSIAMFTVDYVRTSQEPVLPLMFAWQISSPGRLYLSSLFSPFSRSTDPLKT